MNKVKIIVMLILWFSISIPASFAQKMSTRQLIALGDEHFASRQYYRATQFYKQALNSDKQNPKINYQLAESYRLSYSYKNAEIYYSKVDRIGTDQFPLSTFYLAVTQKMNNKYDEAIKGFDYFLNNVKTVTDKSLPDKKRYIDQAKIEKEGCQLAIDRASVPLPESNFQNLKSPVNTLYNDYAPFSYLNDSMVVFTSGRNEAKGRLSDNRLGESFSDQFRFEKTNTGWSEVKIKDDFNVTNTQFSEGAGVFNNTRDKYYFTRCEGPQCQIYVSNQKEGKWQEAVKLNENINAVDTESKQPFVSVSGDSLYFISTRSGGYGMNDIWLSTAEGEDNWGPAVNLGGAINTQFNETSPYYYYDEDLFFFSSSGYPGYGGLDIFYIKNYSKGSGKVENVGKPFNSNLDDVYLMIANAQGYLSSNRTEGLGKFDIYSFDVDPMTFRFNQSEFDKAGNVASNRKNKIRELDTYYANMELLSDDDSGEIILKDSNGSVLFSGTANELEAYYTNSGLMQEDDGNEIIIRSPKGEILFSGTAKQLQAYYSTTGNIAEDDNASIIIKNKDGSIAFSGTAKELAAYYSNAVLLAADDQSQIVIKNKDGGIRFSGSARELDNYYANMSLLADEDSTDILIKDKEGNTLFSGTSRELAAYYTKNGLLDEEDDNALIVIRDKNGNTQFSGTAKELEAYYSTTGNIADNDDATVIIKGGDGAVTFSGTAKELAAYYSNAGKLAADDATQVIIKDSDGSVKFSGTTRELSAYYSNATYTDVDDPTQIIIKDRNGNIKFSGNGRELENYYANISMLEEEDDNELVLRDNSGGIAFSGNARELAAYYAKTGLMQEEDGAIIVIKGKDGKTTFSGTAKELGAYYAQNDQLEENDDMNIIIRDKEGNVTFSGNARELGAYYASSVLLNEDDPLQVIVRTKTPIATAKIEKEQKKSENETSSKAMATPTPTVSKVIPKTEMGRFFRDVLQIEEITSYAYYADFEQQYQKLIDDYIILKVQIGAYEFPNPLHFSDVKTLGAIKTEVVGNLTKFVTGKFTRLQQAEKLRTKAVNQGVDDAFIGIYFEGQRIAVILF